MCKIKQIKFLFVQRTAYTQCLILSLPVYSQKFGCQSRGYPLPHFPTPCSNKFGGKYVCLVWRYSRRLSKERDATEYTMRLLNGSREFLPSSKCHPGTRIQRNAYPNCTVWTAVWHSRNDNCKGIRGTRSKVCPIDTRH
jgi:hypothetical protein